MMTRSKETGARGETAGTAAPWTAALLDWYDGHKRDLPWRAGKDPYHIWVSEVMSQQTRIEAMRPYYEEWMRRFPTMEALAAADEDTVVHAWQGLGYYSRARNLRLGVQEVVNRYGGQVPRERKAMESLRGVGAYTAGAVLSIAFNMREPAVDGNVLRVYARLYNIEDNILKTAGRRRIEELVAATMPYDRPGDFNEALMDFGASLCIPKTPRCDGCPLRSYCAAAAAGTAGRLPVRLKNTKVPTLPVWVGVLSYKGKYLLHRRPNRGLLRSMWEFPAAELMPLTEPRRTADGPRLPKPTAYDLSHVYGEGVAAVTAMLAPLGLRMQVDEERLTELVHVFSHRRWLMEAYGGTLMADDDGDGYPPLPEGWLWAAPEEFAALPWAGPHGKLTVYCPRGDEDRRKQR